MIEFPNPVPDIMGFTVSKQYGKLYFKNFRNFQSRIESVTKLIEQANAQYEIPDFPWTIVNLDDSRDPRCNVGLRVLSASTDDGNLSSCCPDWVFVNWIQSHIFDYEQTINEMSAAGDQPAETNLIGWRGNIDTHINRQNINRFVDPNLYDFKVNRWKVDNIQDKPLEYSSDYVSLPDHVRRWRYLLDIEGMGYSGRNKMLFFSKRVLFWQCGPQREYYYDDLKPWVHYVPVARDFSDFEENLKKIKENVELEDSIRFAAFDYAQNNLRREHAIKRWNKLLGGE